MKPKKGWWGPHARHVVHAWAKDVRAVARGEPRRACCVAQAVACLSALDRGGERHGRVQRGRSATR